MLFLLKILFTFTYLQHTYVLSAYMYVYRMLACHSCSKQKGIRSPGTEGIHGSEPPRGCPESNLRLLKEQQAH